MTISDTPLLPEIGVIAVVPDHWQSTWTTRHYVLTKLSRYFRIVWVEPHIHWWEIRASHFGSLANSRFEEQSRSGVCVQKNNPFLPRTYRPKFLDRILRTARIRSAVSYLKSRGCKKTILYLWRPEDYELLDWIEHDASCYHIDDEYSFSSEELPVDELEVEVIRNVDTVFVHSKRLMQKKGQINPNTEYLPNGVEYGRFQNLTIEPPELSSIPHPRIGYVGVIKKQLDLEMLIELANRRTDCSFVFVGPIGNMSTKTDDLRNLQELANTHFLGCREVEDLPAYIQHLDVCMLCYVVDSYTNCIFPLKLNEYLACGKPVIGSPITTLEDFQVVAVATTVDDWSEAITSQLSQESQSPARIAERKRVAERYDWKDLVHRIAEKLTSTTGHVIPETMRETEDLERPKFDSEDRTIQIQQHEDKKWEI